MSTTTNESTADKPRLLDPEQDLLRVENLKVGFGEKRDVTEIVHGVSFSLAPGECLAIVGESGSGKSVSARTLVGLTGGKSHVSADRMEFDGRDLLSFKDRDWRGLRGKDIGFILQDALVSLDQLRPVGKEIDEALGLHDWGSKKERQERVIELMGDVYPELAAERDNIARWVGDEEESFGRTLVRGQEMLERLVAEARESSTSWIEAEDAFKLHDTYGFPYDLTKELLAEQGLAVDDDGFVELMEEQRTRARTGAATAHGSEDTHARVQEFAAATSPSNFVGYETLRATTGVAAIESQGERALLKLETSPFYAEGGGQVADSGLLRWDGDEAEVVDVYRVGGDQVVAIEAKEIPAGAEVEAVVDRETRHATMRNHTATHLLHAALRERLGTHVRQAGSAVRPDKLRFDFTHGASLSPEELRDVEDRVNEWIKASAPVRWLEMERPEAEALGAMALFGEKYGEWVRVVEIDGVSRELCGGTHVANTAEIGIFKVTAEGSSAANVRRIEAITGPAGIDFFRDRDAALREAGELLGNPQDALAGARRAAERLKEAGAQGEQAQRQALGEEAKRLAGEAYELAGVQVLVAATELTDQKSLLDVANRIQSTLGGDVVQVLAGGDKDKVALVTLATPGAIAKGLSAAELVRTAASVVGGGGGGRDDMAQAGGREPAKIDDALGAARALIEEKLG